MKHIFLFIIFSFIFINSYATDSVLNDRSTQNKLNEVCELTSQDGEIISLLDGQAISLTHIIEAFFSDRSLVDLAKDGFVPAEENKVRRDFAAKWKKNGSTRIFYDKNRPFLELALNCCDSYDDEGSVGKFGIGFFSTLVLLGHEDTDGAFIVVETCYLAKDGNLHAYKMTLDRDEKIFAKFEVLPVDIFEGKTGTKVSIVPKNKDKGFAKSTLSSLKRYMYHLDFYSKAYINLSFQTSLDEEETHEQIGLNYGNQNSVNCKLSPTILYTQDFGSGIPIDVTLTKLLVPSSSTKMANLEEMKEKRERLLAEDAPVVRFVGFKGKEEKTPHVLIGVNDVVVVLVDTGDESLGDKDVWLSMPQIAKLTIARNEVSFSQEGGFEEKYVKKVIARTIEDILLGDNYDNNRLLAVFYQGIKKWEEKSSADIKGRFTIFFKDKLKEVLDNNSHIIPVPIEAYENFRCMLSGDRDIVLLPIDGDLVDYNYVILEDYLKKHFDEEVEQDLGGHKDIKRKALDGKIISSLRVVVVNDSCFDKTSNGKKPIISTFGLKRYLFVPDSVLEEVKSRAWGDNFESELVKQIVDTTSEYDLVPYEGNDERLSVISSNVGEFKRDSFYEWHWFNEPKNKAFFTAEEKFSHFSKKDKKVLQEFFEKNQELILNKNLMGFLYPKRGMVYAVFDVNKFVNSDAFADDILARLFWRDYEAGWKRRDLYYIIYDKSKKEFFVSSLNLDSFASLGYNTPYSDYFYNHDERYDDYDIGDYVKGFSVKPKGAEDNFLESCNLLSQICNPRFYQLQGFVGDTKGEEFFDNWVKLAKVIDPDEKRECLLEKFLLYTFDHGIPPKEGIPDIHYIYKEKLNTDEALEMAGTVKKNIRRYLISHGQTLEIHNFMNNLFGSLILPFSGNKKVHYDGDHAIFVNGKKIWPIEGELSVEKLENLLFTLMYHYLYLDSKNYNRWVEKDFPHPDSEGIDALNKKISSIVLSFPGVDRGELKDLEKWFQDNFLGWIESMEHTFKFALPGLDLYSPVFDLFHWYNNNRGRHELKEEATHLIRQFQETAFGLYNKYFNIKDEDFHSDYGSSRDLGIKIINPNQDMNNSTNVFRLISKLQEYPALLKKLFYFQVVDFKFQTDTSTRKKDFNLEKVFYTPTMLSNTPISILASLLEKKVDFEIIHDILEESRSPEELMFISYTILTRDFYNYCKFDRENIDSIFKKRKELSSSIKLIIRHLLRENMGVERMFELYSQNRVKSSQNERRDLIAQESLVKVIVRFLETVCIQTNFAKEAYSIFDFMIEDDSIESMFRSSQLLKAHATGKGLAEYLELYDLKGAVEKIRDQDVKLNLGKISQSIEDNDEGNPMQSSSTEMLQNSVDAIVDIMAKYKYDVSSIESLLEMRKEKGTLDAKGDLAKVKYTLEWMNDVDGEVGLTHAFLTVRDFVGFPNLNTLMTDFLLPDYNNKGADSVGEMGNGSQKMYKNAKKVLVLTRMIEDPEKAYLLVITPVMDHSTRSVRDLDIIALDVSKVIPEDFFGTSIKVLFRSKPEDETKMDLLLLTNFFRTFIGSLNVDLQGYDYVKVFLNDELLNDKENSKLFSKKINDETGKYDFRLRRLTEDYMPSQVTTGGVPFATLTNFFRNSNILLESLISLLSSGFILDISRDIYEPVVSRKKLQMEPNKMRELREFLLNSCYVEGLKLGKENERFFDINFLHFGSTVGMLSQVSLSDEDNESVQKMVDDFLSSGSKIDLKRCDFFTYYKNSDIGKSFFDYIDNGYKIYGEAAGRKAGEMQREMHAALAKIEEEGLKEILKIKDVAGKRAKLKEVRKEYYELEDKYQEEFQKYRVEELEKWEKSLVKDRYGVVSMVAIPWFEKKPFGLLNRFFNLESKEELMTDEEREIFAVLEKRWVETFGEDFVDNAPLIKDFLDDMLTLYGDLFVEKTGVEKKNLYSVNLYVANDGALGFYTGIGIYLNILYTPIQKFLSTAKHLLAYENTEMFSRIDVIEEMFKPKVGHTPTLIHELEHARRNDKSDRSTHNKCVSPVTGDKIHFDACANVYAKEAVNNGIFKDWKFKITDVARKHFGNQGYDCTRLADSIVRFFKNVKPKEEDYIFKFVMKKLGYISG